MITNTIFQYLTHFTTKSIDTETVMDARRSFNKQLRSQIHFATELIEGDVTYSKTFPSGVKGLVIHQKLIRKSEGGLPEVTLLLCTLLGKHLVKMPPFIDYLFELEPVTEFITSNRTNLVFPLLELNYVNRDGRGQLKDDNNYETDNDSILRTEEGNVNAAVSMSQYSDFTLNGYSQISNNNMAFSNVYDESNFEREPNNRLSEMGYGLEGNKF